MQVKIGDFGLACLDDMNLEESNAETGSGCLSAPGSVCASPVKSPAVGTSYLMLKNSPNTTTQHNFFKENEHTKGVGTSLYASPEQLKGKRYDNKVKEQETGFVFIQFDEFYLFLMLLIFKE
jgi:serine/threonine protein kinase